MLRGIPKHSIQSLTRRYLSLSPHLPPSRFYTKNGMPSEHSQAGPKTLRHPYKEPLLHQGPTTTKERQRHVRLVLEEGGWKWFFSALFLIQFSQRSERLRTLAASDPTKCTCYFNLGLRTRERKWVWLTEKSRSVQIDTVEPAFILRHVRKLIWKQVGRKCHS